MIHYIIIEDEPHIADDLEMMLKQSGRQMELLAKINSVDDAVKWLKNNKADLIFMDIQLHNHLCFEIFDHIQIKIPVVFTTAYNQYMLKSFEVNSLSYLLKPIDEELLYAVIDKYSFLYDNLPDFNETIPPLQPEYQKRFLVQSGNNFHSVATENIAYAYAHKPYVVLVTKDKQELLIDSTLKLLEQRLDPAHFFRINPQFIVNIESIAKIQKEGKAKIKIETNPVGKDEMIISEEKATLFKNWLNH
jgi:DNA-binding LytR/AlgR family response regulator